MGRWGMSRGVGSGRGTCCSTASGAGLTGVTLGDWGRGGRGGRLRVCGDGWFSWGGRTRGRMLDSRWRGRINVLYMGLPREYLLDNGLKTSLVYTDSFI